MFKVWKIQAYVYISNTIVYDVKSYQVKTTIVKWTKLRLKGLYFNFSKKEILVSPTIMWRNKTNLNIKLSRKRF